MEFAFVEFAGWKHILGLSSRTFGCGFYFAPSACDRRCYDG